MNSIFFKVILRDGESIKVDNWDLPHFYSSVHIHPEYQISYIEKGNGYLYFGDSVHTFSPGDIFIIGPNIPHVFVDQDEEISHEKKNIEAIFIFFPRDCTNQVFDHIKEAGSIRELLKQSVCCIKVGEKKRKDVSEEIKKMCDSYSGFIRIMGLMWILYQISLDYVPISIFSSPKNVFTGGSRIEQVLAYTVKNYSNKIEICDVAALTNMTETAFCRFFKNSTGKSYVQFLIELRVGASTKYMLLDNLNLSEIAYKVGFNSITNFIKQFKKVMGVTPSEYRKKIDSRKNLNI